MRRVRKRYCGQKIPVELEASFHFPQAQLAQAISYPRQNRIASISLAKNRGCENPSPPRRTDEERRARARVSYRSGTRLPPSRRSPAAKRCSRRRARVLARSPCTILVDLSSVVDLSNVVDATSARSDATRSSRRRSSSSSSSQTRIQEARNAYYTRLEQRETLARSLKFVPSALGFCLFALFPRSRDKQPRFAPRRTTRSTDTGQNGARRRAATPTPESAW